MDPISLADASAVPFPAPKSQRAFNLHLAVCLDSVLEEHRLDEDENYCSSAEVRLELNDGTIRFAYVVHQVHMAAVTSRVGILARERWPFWWDLGLIRENVEGDELCALICLLKD
jgi:hypothetical protein